MRSQQTRRHVIRCMAATLILFETSAIAQPRVPQRAQPVRIASRTPMAQPRSMGTVPSAAIRRPTVALGTPARPVQSISARQPTATLNPLLSRNHALSAPRLPQPSLRGHSRLPRLAIGNHRPQPMPRPEARPGGIHIAFGFTIGHPAPPPVTIVQPLCVAPAVVSAPIVVAPQPVVQVPVVQPALPAPHGVLFEAVVSRDDEIAPKKMLTVDGIMLKIEDTDRCPLGVDIELSVLGYEQSIEDLPIGSRIDIHGQSGRQFHVDILAIDDDTETLRFAISQ